MKLKLRTPDNFEEALFAGVNSSLEDLLIDEDQDLLVVTGKNKEGERLYLGDIQLNSVKQKGFPTRTIIDRIKFGGLHDRYISETDSDS